MCSDRWLKITSKEYGSEDRTRGEYMAYNVEADNPNCEPDDESTDRDGEAFTLISIDDFYDLLMEQQEQM